LFAITKYLFSFALWQFFFTLIKEFSNILQPSNCKISIISTVLFQLYYRTVRIFRNFTRCSHFYAYRSILNHSVDILPDKPSSYIPVKHLLLSAVRPWGRCMSDPVHTCRWTDMSRNPSHKMHLQYSNTLYWQISFLICYSKIWNNY